jgi:hypothetical protein
MSMAVVPQATAVPGTPERLRPRMSSTRRERLSGGPCSSMDVRPSTQPKISDAGTEFVASRAVEAESDLPADFQMGLDRVQEEIIGDQQWLLLLDDLPEFAAVEIQKELTEEFHLKKMLRLLPKTP